MPKIKKIRSESKKSFVSYKFKSSFAAKPLSMVLCKAKGSCVAGRSATNK
jgi:hypothetical protein